MTAPTHPLDPRTPCPVCGRPDAQTLAAEVVRLRAALAHYADEDHWTRVPPPDEMDTDVWATWPADWYCPLGRDRHGYEVARAALEETTT